MIKSTAPVLRDHGREISVCFYGNLLREVPELKNIFSHTNQLNGKQAGALAGSLYAYADHIDDLGVLSPAIERINQKVFLLVFEVFTPWLMANEDDSTLHYTSSQNNTI